MIVLIGTGYFSIEIENRKRLAKNEVKNYFQLQI